MQQSGQSDKSYLRGNRADDRDLRGLRANKSPKVRAKMHQTVTKPIDSTRRWWVLAIVVAAQFMFGVDAFIVNVAIPTIAVDLKASPAQIESVIAIYLIAYATLVVTGGRLGDIHGTKTVFLAGVLGFTATSLWCGLAQSGVELIMARLAQGATAALMVPQVLATLHLLFTDETRSRAFAVYGIVLGLAGAAGFLLGGVLVSLDLAGTGWRSVFFVNVPFGLVIAAAAWRIMPSVPRRAGTRPDVKGSMVLFAGLLCLIGPLLFGHDVGWAPWLWAVMAIGGVILAAFLKLERAVARAGGMPLIDLTLLADAAFLRGLGAAFFFLRRQPVVLSGHDAVHAARPEDSAACGRHGLHSTCHRFRRGLASQRREGAASRHQGADRRLRVADRRPRRARASCALC
ncbi:MFS family permease [Bradyrhizobium huanghuaihaiense]